MDIKRHSASDRAGKVGTEKKAFICYKKSSTFLFPPKTDSVLLAKHDHKQDPEVCVSTFCFNI